MYLHRSCASTVGVASVQMLCVHTTCCTTGGVATSCASAPVGCIRLHFCLGRLFHWDLNRKGCTLQCNNGCWSCLLPGAHPSCVACCTVPQSGKCCLLYCPPKRPMLLVVLSPKAAKSTACCIPPNVVLKLFLHAALHISGPRPTAWGDAACCWTAPTAWSCLQYLIHCVWVCRLPH